MKRSVFRRERSLESDLQFEAYNRFILYGHPPFVSSDVPLYAKKMPAFVGYTPVRGSIRVCNFAHLDGSQCQSSDMA